ncbi:hypothetical protein PENSPDRAFT_134409 [Peniophora sp. CONT]|nr:hypothetical protein PENSPDRAFT_134409 [Peniophora sp. CONT]
MSSGNSTRECESCGEVHENPFHWKRHLRITALDDLPADPKERATALFHLVDPVDSPEWSDYLKARDTADWEFADRMCPHDDEEDRYAQQVPDCVWDSVSKTIPDDEDLTGRIADAVVVRSCDTRDAGDPTV